MWKICARSEKSVYHQQFDSIIMVHRPNGKEVKLPIENRSEPLKILVDMHTYEHTPRWARNILYLICDRIVVIIR